MLISLVKSVLQGPKLTKTSAQRQSLSTRQSHGRAPHKPQCEKALATQLTLRRARSRMTAIITLRKSTIMKLFEMLNQCTCSRVFGGQY
jgi:division protein CdvB (Snf7/Vps24/ESCRT-III family)